MNHEVTKKHEDHKEEFVSFFFVIFVLLCAFVVRSRAEDRPEDLANKIKAAMIVEFARYTRWPDGRFAHEDSPVVIGVAGDNDLAKVLRELVEREGPRVQGRPVQLVHLDAVDFDDEAQAGRFMGNAEVLHVLYIGEVGREKLRGLLRLMRGKPMLTVSSSPRFADEGGMIGLFLDKRSYRFDINKGSIDRAGLKISAKVLQLARRVIQGPQE